VKQAERGKYPCPCQCERYLIHPDKWDWFVGHALGLQIQWTFINCSIYCVRLMAWIVKPNVSGLKTTPVAFRGRLNKTGRQHRHLASSSKVLCLQTPMSTRYPPR
jgi:hypothetical protein